MYLPGLWTFNTNPLCSLHRAPSRLANGGKAKRAQPSGALVKVFPRHRDMYNLRQNTQKEHISIRNNVKDKTRMGKANKNTTYTWRNDQQINQDNQQINKNNQTINQKNQRYDQMNQICNNICHIVKDLINLIICLISFIYC